MTRLKNAPNVSKQPKGKPYEAYIIAGSTAWDKTKQQTVLEWTKAESDYQPIILGDKQLQEIDRLKLAVDVGTISIYRAGELTENNKQSICQNLAKHSTADTVAFYDEALQLEENTSRYITRLRGKIAENGGGAEIELSDNPTQRELLNAFLEWQPQLARDTNLGTNYAYNGIYWQSLGNEDLERLVMAFFENIEIDFTDRKIVSLAKLVERKIPQMPDGTPDFIGFQNGKLNKLTGEFTAITKDDYLREIEDFELHTKSTDTPHFNQWLEFASNGNKLKKTALLAALYAVLTNRHKWQFYFEVVGVAGAGKSIFGEIAKVINGRGNTTILDIAGFDEQTELAKIIGKSLVLSPEQPYYCGNADGLKRATGGEAVGVRMLYKQGVDYYPKIIFIYATNNVITFTDGRNGSQNSGHLRRKITFYFGRKIPDDVRDDDFIEKVKGEIYGIVKKLLTTFQTPEQAKEVLLLHQQQGEAIEMQRESNHLISFASHFKIDNNRKLEMRWGSARTPLSESKALYKAYLFYCDCIGQRPLGVQHFKRAFAEALKASGENAQIIEGVRDGNKMLNVFFKNYHATMNEWQDG